MIENDIGNFPKTKPNLPTHALANADEGNSPATHDSTPLVQLNSSPKRSLYISITYSISLGFLKPIEIFYRMSKGLKGVKLHSKTLELSRYYGQLTLLLRQPLDNIIGIQCIRYSTKKNLPFL